MELENTPHPVSNGMSAGDAQRLMATAIAQQTGKTVEEVLIFLQGQAIPKEELLEEVPAPKKVPVVSNVKPQPTVVPSKPVVAKNTDQVIRTEDDGFVVTEELTEEEAPVELLNKIAQEDDMQDFSGTIREGSMVKVTYHRDQGVKGRLQFVGRKGKVVRKIGNENATIYMVEFDAGKVPEVRKDPKTGKIQKGYKIKKLQGTFDDTEIELA